MKVPVRIPQNSEVLVKSGQTIDFSTPFHTKKEKKKMDIPLASILKFKPEKIFMHLKKVIGDHIKPGDLIAENKAFLSTRQYVSQIDGIIREINHESGMLVVELETGQDSVVNCFFAGEVAALYDDHLELEVKDALKCELIDECSHYTGAPLSYLSTEQAVLLAEEDIEDRFIVTAVILPLDHIKIEAFGAKAYITDTKKQIEGKIHQHVVKNSDDFERVFRKKYPYALVGVDGKSIYFYTL